MILVKELKNELLNQDVSREETLFFSPFITVTSNSFSKLNCCPVWPHVNWVTMVILTDLRESIRFSAEKL